MYIHIQYVDGGRNGSVPSGRNGTSRYYMYGPLVEIIDSVEGTIYGKLQAESFGAFYICTLPNFRNSYGKAKADPRCLTIQIFFSDSQLAFKPESVSLVSLD